MNVILYNNKSDKRQLVKNITEIKTISATAKGEINIISPTLILEYFSTDFNYCYISDFNRYYFVKSITLLTGQRIQIDLSVDVLMTYKEEIKNLTVNVLRYENIEPTFLTDSRIPLFSDTLQKVIEFPKNIFNLEIPSENSKNFLLTVAGGDFNEWNNKNQWKSIRQ